MNPIYKSMMLWEHSNCREQTVADWIATLQSGGIDIFKPKALDGTDFMSRYYSHPLAPSSLDQIQQQYEQFRAAGIGYLSWVVPNGHDVAAEANLTIEVAKRCGNKIEIDLEPYDGFWTGPYSGIPEFFKRLKDAGIWVVCNVDTRGNLADPLQLDRIASLIDRHCSQSYDVGFGVPYKPLYDHAVQYLKQMGAKEIGIVLDARAGTGVVERAEYAQSLGCVEVSCWAADMATAATYAGFKAIPLRTTPVEALHAETPRFVWKEPFAAYAAELKGSDDDPGQPTGDAYQCSQDGDLMQWGQRRILYYNAQQHMVLCVSKFKQVAA